MFSVIRGCGAKGKDVSALFSPDEHYVPECSLAKWAGEVCFGTISSFNADQPAELLSAITQPPAGGRVLSAFYLGQAEC